MVTHPNADGRKAHSIMECKKTQDGKLHSKILHQFEKNSFVASSIENTNILNEELHIKDQSSDQGYILASRENTNFRNSSIVPIIKQESSETCDKYKPFNDPEKLGSFVKSERNIKPENSFDINVFFYQNKSLT